jgi:hypothetical protein
MHHTAEQSRWAQIKYVHDLLYLRKNPMDVAPTRCIRTLRMKVKREGYAWLNAAALEVNQVWNWANATSVKAARPFAGPSVWLNGYDLDKLPVRQRERVFALKRAAEPDFLSAQGTETRADGGGMNTGIISTWHFQRNKRNICAVWRIP